MKSTRDILKNKKYNNVNTNDILNNVSNDNENTSENEYALNKQEFTPNTEKTQLAEEIATFLHDLDNYACFLSVVNKIEILRAKTLFANVKSDIEEKANTKTPVRYPAKYFMWKFKKGLY